MEIGHGGGRLLAAAAAHFKEAIGIDVHDCNDKVAEELRRRGVSNFRLLKTDGRGIPMEDSSADFVYSFIVLQHVEKFDVFVRYMADTARVLKTGGIAVLYFGRKYFLSAGMGSRLLYRLDRALERVFLPKGYRELPARVNETNLVVSLPRAKALARDAGLKVLAELVSRKNVPDGARLFGRQHGLILGK